MSSFNWFLRARLTFLNLSNAVTVGAGFGRARTLVVAGRNIFEREDEETDTIAGV